MQWLRERGGYPPFSLFLSTRSSSHAPSQLTSSAAFSHESSSAMTRERERGRDRGSSIQTEESVLSFRFWRLGSFFSQEKKEKPRFSGKRAPCWHSLGLLLAAERLVGCLCSRYGGEKEGKLKAIPSRKKRTRSERENRARKERAPEEAPQFCGALTRKSWGARRLVESSISFVLRLLENFNAVRDLVASSSSPSLRAMEEELPRAAAGDNAVAVAVSNGSGARKDTATTSGRAPAATTAKREKPSTSTSLPMPSTPLPAPLRRAIRAHRRRGDNAGLHFLICGDVLTIGATGERLECFSFSFFFID